MTSDGPRGKDETRWLIVGADGQIGSALMNALSQRGAAVLGTTRRPASGEARLIFLDLAEPELVLEPSTIDVAVFCAGMTGFAACEADPVLSHRINVDGAVQVMDALAAAGVHVIYLSSNAVFDGSVAFVNVNAAPMPVSLYGRQKAQVEAHLTTRHPVSASILRLTKVVGPNAPFIRTWTLALEQGQPIMAFENRLVCPVTEDAVVTAIRVIGQRRSAGLWQLSGEAEISFAAFARQWFSGRPAALAAIQATQAPEVSSRRHGSMQTHLPQAP